MIAFKDKCSLDLVLKIGQFIEDYLYCMTSFAAVYAELQLVTWVEEFQVGFQDVTFLGRRISGCHVLG